MKKPKILNLTEIHRLYQILKPALPKKEDVASSIMAIFQNSPSGTVEQCLSIMYPKHKGKVEVLDIIQMFVEGMRQNDFFSYVKFIEGFSRNVQSR